MVHAGNLRAHHRPRGLEEPDGHLLEGSPACLCAAQFWVLHKVVQNNVYYALEIVLGCLALRGVHVVASNFSMRSLLHQILNQVSQSAYCHMKFRGGSSNC